MLPPPPQDAWAALQLRNSALAAFRDAALDRWQRRTLLSSGGAAMRGNLRALNQSISSQVQNRAAGWGGHVHPRGGAHTSRGWGLPATAPVSCPGACLLLPLLPALGLPALLMPACYCRWPLCCVTR